MQYITATDVNHPQLRRSSSSNALSTTLLLTSPLRRWVASAQLLSWNQLIGTLVLSISSNGVSYWYEWSCWPDPHVASKLVIKTWFVQIKAWCYYESRLLGAPHGLLSTYALETMVLYIFNVYHNNLHTPCQVQCPTAAAMLHGGANGNILCFTRFYTGSLTFSVNLIGTSIASACKGRCPYLVFRILQVYSLWSFD